MIQLDKSPNKTMTWLKPQVGKSGLVSVSCTCQYSIKIGKPINQKSWKVHI